MAGKPKKRGLEEEEVKKRRDVDADDMDLGEPKEPDELSEAEEEDEWLDGMSEEESY